MKYRAKKDLKDAKKYNSKEWQASNSGYMPQLQHKNIQNRKSIILITIFRFYGAIYFNIPKCLALLYLTQFVLLLRSSSPISSSIYGSRPVQIKDIVSAPDLLMCSSNQLAYCGQILQIVSCLLGLLSHSKWYSITLLKYFGQAIISARIANSCCQRNIAVFTTKNGP